MGHEYMIAPYAVADFLSLQGCNPYFTETVIFIEERDAYR
jgi:hypothetical protein